jgi:hypothetical protein
MSAAPVPSLHVGPDYIGGTPIYLPDDRHIATVFRGPGFDSRQIGTLLAAAPDLLFLLFLALKVAEHFEYTDAPLGILARAVIEKAEGQS